MRTIPPYVAALAVIALMTGNLMTADTLRYLFYVENLFRFGERGRLLPRRLEPRGRGMVLSSVRAAAVPGRPAPRPQRPAVRSRLCGPVHPRRRRAEDLRCAARLGPNVRRATVFRIDSIVWGYLLYLALETGGLSRR